MKHTFHFILTPFTLRLRRTAAIIAFSYVVARSRNRARPGRICLMRSAWPATDAGMVVTENRIVQAGEDGTFAISNAESINLLADLRDLGS